MGNPHQDLSLEWHTKIEVFIKGQDVRIEALAPNRLKNVPKSKNLKRGDQALMRQLQTGRAKGKNKSSVYGMEYTGLAWT